MNKEYLFEEISLEECCREVLDEYRLYLEEKQILVQLDLKEKTVLSDRKSLCFMLSQLRILSNTQDMKPKSVRS